MKITFYGHASLGIEVSGKFILVDPFISGNPKAAHINLESLKPDYIFLTHAHQDHTLDVEFIMVHNPQAVIVSNAEIVTHYAAKGYKGHMMNHGGSWKFEFGVVKYVNAIHSSSFADGTYGGNPGGFVIEGEHKNIYIAGDTALTLDMQLISRWATLDFAILSIGDNFTMGYEDAVVAAEFIKAPKVIGMHYDTFGWIKIDHNMATKAFTDKGIELLLLSVGEIVHL